MVALHKHPNRLTCVFVVGSAHVTSSKRAISSVVCGRTHAITVVHPPTHARAEKAEPAAFTCIKIEHTFSRRKKYQIAALIYRNRDEDYDRTMNIVAGLVNLRAYDRIFQRTGLQL